MEKKTHTHSDGQKDRSTRNYPRSLNGADVRTHAEYNGLCHINVTMRDKGITRAHDRD